jgi:ABC-type transporter Mla subunit MlaD
MSFKENKGVWLGIAAGVLAITALIWLLVSGGPSRLIVLFPDIGDLKREDPVVWRTYTIGRVDKIEPMVDNQIAVTIRIREDYVSRITQGARFTLRRASLFGLIGNNAIEVETPSEPGRPFMDGEMVQGISPPKPSLVQQGKEWTLENWQQLKDQAAQLLEEYRKSPYRKEVEDALTQLGALAAEGARQAKEGLAQFRKDHQKDLDTALQKLEQARDWMREKGDEAGARKIQDEIDRVKK